MARIICEKIFSLCREIAFFFSRADKDIRYIFAVQSALRQMSEGIKNTE